MDLRICQAFTLPRPSITSHMSKRERETDRDDVEGETEPAPDSEVVEQAESDDDDDFGPMPANEAAPVNAEVAHQKKRRSM